MRLAKQISRLLSARDAVVIGTEKTQNDTRRAESFSAIIAETAVVGFHDFEALELKGPYMWKALIV
jgi:hypothetical protein